MILRRWIGYAAPANAGIYEEHIRADVFPKLNEIPGFVQAYLIRRTIGDEVEFQALTFWTSLEVVRGFAGSDYGKAVIEPEARRALSRFEETVDFFEVAVATAPGTSTAR